MAVSRFEVGKYYRWIGPKDFRDNWNDQMEAWKDGKARKCTEIDTGDNVNASFDGINNDEYHPYGWQYYHCIQHFEEVLGRDIPYVLHITIRESDKATRRRDVLSRLTIE